MRFSSLSSGPRRGLLLDLDGTLADSLTAMQDAHRRFLHHFGTQPAKDEFDRLNGPPLDEIISILRELHGLPGETEALKEKYLKLIYEAHASAGPSEGALDLVRTAARNGWCMAVVTSSTRASALDWLKRNSFADYISEVVGGDDVEKGKPDPAPYLQALVSLDCKAENSWAVEDSRQGAQAAVAAGLRTFVITADDQRSDWPKGPTFLNSLCELKVRIDRAED